MSQRHPNRKPNKPRISFSCVPLRRRSKAGNSPTTDPEPAARPAATAAMAPREPPTKKIRILCFGDSLTAGYSRMGSVYHPYSEKLVQMVEMAFPEYEVESVEDGVPGDLVSGRGTFLSRMERQCMSTALLTSFCITADRCDSCQRQHIQTHLRLDHCSRRYKVCPYLSPPLPRPLPLPPTNISQRHSMGRRSRNNILIPPSDLLHSPIALLKSPSPHNPRSGHTPRPGERPRKRQTRPSK